MLTEADNELLCRVGPGTPMGAMLREYWHPVLLSHEVPSPNGNPIRVRLLGEDLIAFRDTSGRVGMLADHCSHRGASLFFGRNEDNGLRCVYHGWKYDVEGRCVDLPNEPPESSFEERRGRISRPHIRPHHPAPLLARIGWVADLCGIHREIDITGGGKL